MQETEERILQKEKEKMERAIQQRLDIALANEYQRQLKAIRRDEEKREEDEFRRRMRESLLAFSLPYPPPAAAWQAVNHASSPHQRSSLLAHTPIATILAQWTSSRRMTVWTK